ncbi:MAG: hypothetical protein LUQ32_03485 [Methanomicrobiales archaeon]|nr:hypothetical protein [Methanomicrobiales archaeon]
MELKREAVSESIGYLIIFGLILTGIGLITLYGYPLLMQQQSSANMRNMEQTMIVLQNDIKSLTYKLANYKETSLRVSGGTLSLYGPSYTPQKFKITTDGSMDQDYFLPGELRYSSTSDNTVISLENGAVIEKPLSIKGSFMLADPRWYLDNSSGQRTLVINFMNLSGMASSSQLLSQTGIGTVRMRLLRTNMTTRGTPWPASPNGQLITITYYPDNNKTVMPDGYGLAWKTYLTNPNNFEGGMTCTGDPLLAQHLDCRISDIQNIVVKEYDIVVETL